MRVGMSRHVDEPIRPPLGINQASLGQTFPLLELVTIIFSCSTKYGSDDFFFKPILFFLCFLIGFTYSLDESDDYEDERVRVLGRTRTRTRTSTRADDEDEDEDHNDYEDDEDHNDYEDEDEDHNDYKGDEDHNGYEDEDEDEDGEDPQDPLRHTGPQIDTLGPPFIWRTREGGQLKKKWKKLQVWRQKSAPNVGNPYSMEDSKAAPQGDGASRRPLGVLVVFHLVRISYVFAYFCSLLLLRD